MRTVVAIPEQWAAPLVLQFPTDAADSFEVYARRLLFIHPFGLVQLILLLHFLSQRAPEVRFLAPSSQDVGAYLARMDFYNHMPPRVTLVDAVNPETLRRTDRSDVLIALKRFRTSTDVEELTEDIRRFLQIQNLPSPLYSVLWQVVAELCGNAASHSGSAAGGLLVARAMRVNAAI